jgi:arylsulfatase A-like enzyme
MAGRSTQDGLSRRDFIRVTAAGAAAAALPGRITAGDIAGTERRPNVIVLFDDQLRSDACSLFGGRNITTPNIDRLATQGVTFNNATSVCPLCTPFRGMLQTGRYPTHSGLVLNWVEVNPHQRNIAHVLDDAGYHTGFIGKWHLAAGRQKKSGYHYRNAEERQKAENAAQAYAQENPETEYVPPGAARLGYEHWQAYNFHGAFKDYWYYENQPVKKRRSGFETDIQIDQAIEFIKGEKDSTRPFFLMVAPHPPHQPWQPAMCPDGYLSKIPTELQWLPNVPQDYHYRKNPEAARCYYAMAKNMDDNLGRLMAFLDSSGLTENTILIFTADHGEMLGSHGREQKMVPYAEAVNIPLIVRWPGHVPAGVRTDVLHTPMDHFPTLCRLAGLDAPGDLDGLDLSETLLKGTKPDRNEILMANYVSNWDFFDSGTDYPEWRGVRTERHTYVKWLSGKEELYDNQEDRYQMRNLAEAGQDLPTMQKLRSRLKDLLAEAHDTFMPGTGYAEWYDAQRNLVRTGLGPI